ncbi:MAG: ethanolamine ammonia-lyase subunit EutC [Pseudomonadota bacterium]
MSDETRIRDIVRLIVEEEAKARDTGPKAPIPRSAVDAGLAKRVARWLGASLPLPPALGDWRPQTTREGYLAASPARLGVGRAGVRLRTDTALRFLADHAAARDAVASDIEASVIGSLGFVSLRSAAADKREFLVRPDLGRRLSNDSAAAVSKEAQRSPRVQIVAVDGLSATAINVNLPLVYPGLVAELGRRGIRTGTPVAVTNGRVAAGDHVARQTGAALLVTLVGERPGLKTAESMGVYITYMKVKRFNEAMRYVISNVHSAGLRPEEAVLQIADLCEKSLAEKKTGVDFSQ